MNKIGYLVDILRDQDLDIYKERYKFWKEEKPKVTRILEYYGLTEEVDYELFLKDNWDFGTKRFSIRIYFDADLNDGSWDEEDPDNNDIFRTYTICEY